MTKQSATKYLCNLPYRQAGAGFGVGIKVFLGKAMPLA